MTCLLFSLGYLQCSSDQSPVQSCLSVSVFFFSFKPRVMVLHMGKDVQAIQVCLRILIESAFSLQ